MKRFTTSYYEDYDYKSEYGKQPEGFDSVNEAVQWNESRDIPLYLVRMTEWDLESLDYMGVPEILEQGSLESWAVDDFN